MKPPAKGTLAAKLRDYALGFPETHEDFPWGERALKVRSKAFLFMGGDGDDLSFSVKLPRTGVQALALPFAEPTHYGLGKHGWVTIKVPKKPTRAMTDQFLEWIRESYVAVAPKKLGASVDAAAK